MRLTRRGKYKRAVLNLLEQEVKMYHQTLELLEESKLEIIDAASDGSEIKSKGTNSDVVARKVVQLMSSPVIAEMEKRIKAIERAIDEWIIKEPSVRMAFIKMRFWDNRLTNDGIAMELGIGESTVRHWRNNFLELVAKYLGWRI